MTEILFILASIASIFTTIFLINKFITQREIRQFIWSISIFALFLMNTMLALQNINVLNTPYTSIISAFIPAFLTSGIFLAAFPQRRLGTYYLIYVCILIVMLVLTKIAKFENFVDPIIMLIHAPSGLISFLLPLIGTILKKVKWTSLFITLGSLLISFVGVALVSFKAGIVILPIEVILSFLSVILFLVTVFFAVGLIFTPDWRF